MAMALLAIGTNAALAADPKRSGDRKTLVFELPFGRAQS
jgi:hypothetical protein